MLRQAVKIRLSLQSRRFLLSAPTRAHTQPLSLHASPVLRPPPLCVRTKYSKAPKDKSGGSEGTGVSTRSHSGVAGELQAQAEEVNELRGSLAGMQKALGDMQGSLSAVEKSVTEGFGKVAESSSRWEKWRNSLIGALGAAGALICAMGFFRDWILVHLINPIWESSLTEDDRKTVDICHVAAQRQVSDYIQSNAPHGLLVTGVRDAGKSVAVCRVIEKFKDGENKTSKHLLVCFNTSEVSTLDELVSSFERDLGYSDLLKFVNAVQSRVGLTPEDTHDPVVRMKAIFHALRTIGTNKKLVIVVDDFENIMKACASPDRTLSTAAKGIITSLNNICRDQRARVVIVSSDMNALAFFQRDRKFSEAVYFRELDKSEAYDFIRTSLTQGNLNVSIDSILLIRDTFSNLVSELHSICDAVLECTADLVGAPAENVQERIRAFTQRVHQTRINVMEARLSKLRRGWDHDRIQRFACLLELLEVAGRHGVDSDEIEWRGLHDVADILLQEHLVVLEGSQFISSDKYFTDAIPYIVEKLQRTIKYVKQCSKTQPKESKDSRDSKDKEQGK